MKSTSKTKKHPPAAAVFTPVKCLKQAGLGHVKSVGPGRWQGTTGANPRSDVNASVFVSGPLSSADAVNAEVSKVHLQEIAFSGGKYIVTATNASYLASTVSLAASCLMAGSATKYTF